MERLVLVGWSQGESAFTTVRLENPPVQERAHLLGTAWGRAWSTDGHTLAWVDTGSSGESMVHTRRLDGSWALTEAVEAQVRDTAVLGDSVLLCHPDGLDVLHLQLGQARYLPLGSREGCEALVRDGSTTVAVLRGASPNIRRESSRGRLRAQIYQARSDGMVEQGASTDLHEVGSWELAQVSVRREELSLILMARRVRKAALWMGHLGDPDSFELVQRAQPSAWKGVDQGFTHAGAALILDREHQGLLVWQAEYPEQAPRPLVLGGRVNGVVPFEGDRVWTLVDGDELREVDVLTGTTHQSLELEGSWSELLR